MLFVSGAALLLVIPVPAVTYVVSRSIGQGRTAGLLSVLGIVVGTLLHVTAATLGLSALLASSILAFQFVKYLGASIDEARRRSEEHTSELQSPDHLVCRLLLEKKKKQPQYCVIDDDTY